MEWLLSSDDTRKEPLVLTHGILLELSHIREINNCTYLDMAKWIQRLTCSPNLSPANSLRYQVTQTVKEKSKLRVQPDKQKTFLDNIWVPPEKNKRIPIRKAEQDPSHKETVTSRNDNVTFPFPTLALLCSNVLQAVYLDTCETKIPLLTNIDDNIKKSLKQLDEVEKNISKSKEALSILNDKKGRYNPKNVYRRDKRHEEAKKALTEASKTIEQLKEMATKLQRDKDNAMKNKSKWKVEARKRRSEDSSCAECELKKGKIGQLKGQINALEWENSQLNMQIEDLVLEKEPQQDSKPPSNTIITKESGRYTDNIRQVWMELLSLGVAVGKVAKVVKIAVEGLTNQKIQELPSKGLTSHLQTEAQIVSQYQMADLLTNTDKATAHLDGTKKRFREYGSFQLSLRSAEGPKGLCLGVEEMASGEAQAYLDTMMELFNDIAEAFSGDPLKVREVAAELLSNVKNLMTDRHIVNKKFKELFEKARDTIFTDHLQGYTTMDNNQKERLTKLHSFYCGLHVLCNMGTIAAKSLLTFEEIALAEGAKISSHAFNKGNARTFDLIFEVSQAMTRTGNQRSGCASNWEDFLAQTNEKNLIESFLHHRFNIVFVDAGAIFYHRNHILEFLGGYNLNNNRLLECILESLRSPVCLGGLKALGLIGLCISSPLCSILERDK
jgi:hypothetical protein